MTDSRDLISLFATLQHRLETFVKEEIRDALSMEGRMKDLESFERTEKHRRTELEEKVRRMAWNQKILMAVVINILLLGVNLASGSVSEIIVDILKSMVL